MTITPNPSQVDRLDGVNEGIAAKAPVRAATTVNITLSGEQTIDGIACVADDRVLVKNQANAKQNGIYDVSTGTWRRALDANGNRDLVEGSRVWVTEGNTLGRTEWACTTDNPIIIDTSDIAFVQVAGDGGGGFPNATYWTVADEAADLPNSRQAIAGTGIVITDGGAGDTIEVAATPDVCTAQLILVIDGAGSVITTGVKADIPIGFACTITRVELLGDQSGSIVVDIWKDTYSNFPPTIADTITASAKPTITSTTKSEDTTLTGWTTAIAAGDILRINVDSVASLTRCTLGLRLLKS